MMSLKSQVVKGFSWSVFENIFSQGTAFVVYIVLARLLQPEDFGIIAIIMAIVSISGTIADGGLGSSLIQKKHPSQDDYDSVFVSNLVIACLLYAILVVSAKPIADFYDQPDLPKLLYVTGSILIIQSLSTIQLTKMEKHLNFKTLSIISVVSTFIAGVLALCAAYLKYGVWSLVVFSVAEPLVETLIVLVIYDWYPKLKFSKKSF